MIKPSRNRIVTELNSYCYNNDIDVLINTFQSIHKQIAPEIDFRFQIGLSRHCPIHMLEKWVEPFLERDCFHSIDLYSDDILIFNQSVSQEYLNLYREGVFTAEELNIIRNYGLESGVKVSRV